MSEEMRNHVWLKIKLYFALMFEEFSSYIRAYYEEIDNHDSVELSEFDHNEFKIDDHSSTKHTQDYVS